MEVNEVIPNPPLTGITLDSETIIFDGFGEAPDGVKIGYVPEKDNAIFSRLMDAGKLLVAYITGMQKRSVDYQQISIGIYLVDFEVQLPAYKPWWSFQEEGSRIDHIIPVKNW